MPKHKVSKDKGGVVRRQRTPYPMVGGDAGSAKHGDAGGGDDGLEGNHCEDNGRMGDVDVGVGVGW